MNESQISVRYAKALFQSASEKQMLDEAYHDMELLSEVCKTGRFHLYACVTFIAGQSKEKGNKGDIWAASFRVVNIND